MRSVGDSCAVGNNMSTPGHGYALQTLMVHAEQRKKIAPSSTVRRVELGSVSRTEP